jgi:hypothetical protein
VAGTSEKMCHRYRKTDKTAIGILLPLFYGKKQNPVIDAA